MATSCSGNDSYQDWLVRPSTTERQRSMSALQVTEEKFAVLRKDPYAMELAGRLLAAFIHSAMGDSYRTCYERCAPYTGKVTSDNCPVWMLLSMIYLEDNKYGKGLAGSIVCHPIMESFPHLRNIEDARQDSRQSHVANRFQAAFETMSSFDPLRPKRGISSFADHLEKIEVAEDVWLVLAGIYLNL